MTIFKKIWSWIANNPTGNFVARYTVIAMLLGLIVWFFVLGAKEIESILLILMFEVLALVISGLACFVYTGINFVKEILYPEKTPSQLSDVERAALIGVVGDIFKSVHILVGLGIFAVYLSRFAF